MDIQAVALSELGGEAWESLFDDLVLLDSMGELPVLFCNPIPRAREGEESLESVWNMEKSTLAWTLWSSSRRSGQDDDREAVNTFLLKSWQSLIPERDDNPELGRRPTFCRFSSEPPWPCRRVRFSSVLLTVDASRDCSSLRELLEDVLEVGRGGRETSGAPRAVVGPLLRPVGGRCCRD